MRDEFYGVFCDYETVPPCSEVEFGEVVERLGFWNFWTIMEAEDGKTYISSYCNAVAEEILQKRLKYPVKWYCIFDDEIVDRLKLDNWKSAFPVYGRIFSHLFFECRWNPDSVGELLEQLLKCIAMGMTEQEYFEFIQDSFEGSQIHLTKKMKNCSENYVMSSHLPH